MEALGINIVNLVINLVLFVLFFSILHKMVLKKLTAVLDQRKATIDAGVQNTQKSKEVLETAEIEFNEIRKKAQEESEVIIKEARKLSEIESKRILSEVEVEANLIREKSVALLDIHKQKLEVEFDTRVEQAVKVALEKIFKENPDFRL
jgi:F-type H+-transporting ATPase subunit b